MFLLLVVIVDAEASICIHLEHIIRAVAGEGTNSLWKLTSDYAATPMLSILACHWSSNIMAVLYYVAQLSPSAAFRRPLTMLYWLPPVSGKSKYSATLDAATSCDVAEDETSDLKITWHLDVMSSDVAILTQRLSLSCRESSYLSIRYDYLIFPLIFYSSRIRFGLMLSCPFSWSLWLQIVRIYELNWRI